MIPIVFEAIGSVNLELAHATPEPVAVNPIDSLYTTDGTADAIYSPTQLSDSSGDVTPLAPSGKSYPSRVLITDDNPINRKVYN